MKKQFYDFIYEFINDKKVMQYEVKKEASFIMYRGLLIITQKLKFNDLLLFSYIDYININAYNKIKLNDDQILLIEKIRICKLKILKFCLFYI